MREGILRFLEQVATIKASVTYIACGFWWIILSAPLLAACGESAVERAERRLAWIEQAGGSPDEVCDATTAVAEAYLDEGTQQEYESAELSASTQCLYAKALRERGI